MSASLAAADVAVVGGDLRQLAVAEALAGTAGRVRTYGLPVSRDERVQAAGSLAEALRGATVVILPIGGIGPDGRVRSLPDQPAVLVDKDFWQALDPGIMILAGSMTAAGRQAAAAGGHGLIEYAELDEIAIPNSIPTAEGALQLAMEEMPITIHGCCCFVLGLGRVGMTTARLFKAVGAETWVVANRPALQARAVEMGCRAIDFGGLLREIHRADLVINTVPSLVVTGPILAETKTGVFLIDLASAPGGIDYQAAEALGRHAKLALGLPGKVAPISAGRILAAALPALIERELAKAR